MAFNFTIGADPELFVRGPKGTPVTAHGLIPGDKKAPFKVNDGAVQVDGMALEYNIDPSPYTDFDAFNSKIVSVMKQMHDMLPEGHKFMIQPSVQFDPTYYNENVPQEAKELGCDPDFCAYSEDIFAPNPRPDGDSGLRSAAGHIHIGWGADIPVDSEEHINVCRHIVKNLDATVGLGMLLIDGDTERRKLYGKAGAYRPKTYGVEYRTPSNAWVGSREKRRWIHVLTQDAINNARVARPFFKTMEEAGFDVQSIINNGDADQARSLLNSRVRRVPASIANILKKG